MGAIRSLPSQLSSPLGDLAGKTPLFVLPHAPGSSLLHDALILEGAPAFAPDFPGHGESDPLPGNPQNVETWTETAAKVLERLNVANVHLYGHNGGAAVAMELAHRLGRRVAGLVLDAHCFLGDEDRRGVHSRYSPEVLPVWEGSDCAPGTILRASWSKSKSEFCWPVIKSQFAVDASLKLCTSAATGWYS
jgi:pimeloyl-ACP methyl ester carboxylesterase